MQYFTKRMRDRYGADPGGKWGHFLWTDISEKTESDMSLTWDFRRKLNETAAVQFVLFGSASNYQKAFKNAERIEHY